MKFKELTKLAVTSVNSQNWTFFNQFDKETIDGFSRYFNRNRDGFPSAVEREVHELFLKKGLIQ